MKKSELQLVRANLEIEQSPEDDREIAFLARQLVQATLPYTPVKGDPPEWYRTNGDFTLSVRPGYKFNPKTKKRVCLGYPYGSMPRLLLFWMTTEAIRTQSRRLELGGSLKEFMEAIGVSTYTGGGKRSNPTRLKNQMDRLFRASISFDYQTDRQESYINMDVASETTLWFDPKKPTQDDLFESWVELGEKFYKGITEAPIPLDMAAIRALKKSPIALDLYSWLTYKTWIATQRGKPTFVGWRTLQKQMGSDTLRHRKFKENALEALRKVYLVYPNLCIEEIDERHRSGIKISPSRPAILPK